MAEAWSDEATAQFLSAAADDLQRQLGAAGVVQGLSVVGAASNVTLVAQVHVGQRPHHVSGTGENLITAYADLRRREPELVLAAAYRELVESIT